MPGAASTEAKPDVVCYWAEADAEANAGIREKLRQPLTTVGLDFTETPLEEILAFVRDEYDLAIQIDVRALDEFGIPLDEQVTVNIGNTSLGSGLRLLLESLELTYVVQGGTLLITTEEEAINWFVPAVYPIGGLFSAGGKAEVPHDPAELAAVIKATVAPGTWAPDGGAATIHVLPGNLLVIAQSRAVHEDIRALLRAVKLARQHEQ